VIAAGVIVALAGPWALASDPSGIVGGKRNPSNNPSVSYSRETQIIGDVAEGQGGLAPGTGGYTTRQSNKSSSGGGAIYGCRARAGTNPCLAAVNLSNGRAFQFFSGLGASSVGSITFGLSSSKTVDEPPFTTNGTGLVKNLNADMVGGRHASDLVSTGQLLFATVDATGKLGANRGATASSFATAPATGPTGVTSPVPTYTVTFGSSDVSKCAYTATPSALSAGAVAAAAAPTAPGSAAHSVVVTESGTATGFSLQVTC
jgi:hypothetical protein